MLQEADLLRARVMDDGCLAFQFSCQTCDLGQWVHSSVVFLSGPVHMHVARDHIQRVHSLVTVVFQCG